MVSHQHPARPERGRHHAKAVHLVIPKAAPGQQVRLVESDEDVNSVALGAVKLAILVLRKE